MKPKSNTGVDSPSLPCLLTAVCLPAMTQREFFSFFFTGLTQCSSQEKMMWMVVLVVRTFSVETFVLNVKQTLEEEDEDVSVSKPDPGPAAGGSTPPQRGQCEAEYVFLTLLMGAQALTVVAALVKMLRDVRKHGGVSADDGRSNARRQFWFTLLTNTPSFIRSCLTSLNASTPNNTDV
ncbi:hypothetical protein INR49_020775 [Caranx melampygus]|nr:hypothetical protein INR49_020775 [Caranx melampygus]